MDQLPTKIKTDDYRKPQLRALLFVFPLPHQTLFLLYKYRFDEVNFTRRCFYDVNVLKSTSDNSFLHFIYILLLRPKLS